MKVGELIEALKPFLADDLVMLGKPGEHFEDVFEIERLFVKHCHCCAVTHLTDYGQQDGFHAVCIVPEGDEK